MATALDNLTAARDSLAQAVAQAAADEAAGTPNVDYSLDGKSVSYNQWLSAKAKQIADLNDLICQLQGPVWLVSRDVP